MVLSMWLLPMATDYDRLGVAHCNGRDSNGDGRSRPTVPSVHMHLQSGRAWMGPLSFQMVCAGGSASVAPDRNRCGAASELDRTLNDGFNGVNSTHVFDCTLALVGSQAGSLHGRLTSI